MAASLVTLGIVVLTSNGDNNDPVSVNRSSGPHWARGTTFVSSYQESGSAVTIFEPGAKDRIVPTQPALFLEAAPNGDGSTRAVYVISVDHPETVTSDGRRIVVTVLRPDHAKPKSVAVGSTMNPQPIPVAPAGTQGAGKLYFVDTAKGALITLDPVTAKLSSIHLGANLGLPVVAPAGTPNAGTVYVPVFGRFDRRAHGAVAAIAPGSGRARMIELSDSPSGLAVAPEGTTNPGTLYVTSRNQSSNRSSVSVLGPHDESAHHVATFDSNAIALPPLIMQPDQGSASSSVLIPLVGGRSEEGSGYQVAILSADEKRIARTLDVAGPTRQDQGNPTATVFALTNGTYSTVDILDAGADSVRTLDLGGKVNVPEPIVAPPGSPLAGTAYVSLFNGTAIIPAGSTGKTNFLEGTYYVGISGDNTPNPGNLFLRTFDEFFEAKPDGTKIRSLDIKGDPGAVLVAP